MRNSDTVDRCWRVLVKVEVTILNFSPNPDSRRVYVNEASKVLTKARAQSTVAAWELRSATEKGRASEEIETIPTGEPELTNVSRIIIFHANRMV